MIFKMTLLFKTEWVPGTHIHEYSRQPCICMISHKNSPILEIMPCAWILSILHKIITCFINNLQRQCVFQKLLVKKHFVCWISFMRGKIKFISYMNKIIKPTLTLNYSSVNVELGFSRSSRIMTQDRASISIKMLNAQ